MAARRPRVRVPLARVVPWGRRRHHGRALVGLGEEGEQVEEETNEESRQREREEIQRLQDPRANLPPEQISRLGKLAKRLKEDIGVRDLINRMNMRGKY